jgi:putative membrane protein
LTETRAPVRGALIGLVAGLLAAFAMSLAHRGVERILLKPAAPAAQQPEDAIVKVASAILRLVGRTLTEDEKPLAGTVVHYAFGASVGAVYGALAELAPRVTAGLGLPFGLAVWLGAHVVTVPALGLAEPPTRQPLGKEGVELGLHLVYGMVTELARRLLRR